MQVSKKKSSPEREAVERSKKLVNCVCEVPEHDVPFDAMRASDRCQHNGIVFVEPGTGATYHHGQYLTPIVVEGVSHYRNNAITKRYNAHFIDRWHKCGIFCPFECASALVKNNKFLFVAYDFMPTRYDANMPHGFDNPHSQLSRIIYAVLTRWDRYPEETRREFMLKNLGTCAWESDILPTYHANRHMDSMRKCVSETVEDEYFMGLIATLQSHEIALLPVISNGLSHFSRNYMPSKNIYMNEMLEIEIGRRFSSGELAICVGEERDQINDLLENHPFLTYLIFLHAITSVFDNMVNFVDRPVCAQLHASDPKSVMGMLTGSGGSAPLIHKKIANYVLSGVLPNTESIKIDLSDNSVLLLTGGHDDVHLVSDLKRFISTFASPELGVDVVETYARAVSDEYACEEPKLKSMKPGDVLMWFVIQIVYESRLMVMQKQDTVPIKHHAVIDKLTDMHARNAHDWINRLEAELSSGGSSACEAGNKKKKKKKKKDAKKYDRHEEHQENETFWDADDRFNEDVEIDSIVCDDDKQTSPVDSVLVTAMEPSVPIIKNAGVALYCFPDPSGVNIWAYSTE